MLSCPFRPLRGSARAARCALILPLRGSPGPVRFLFAGKPEAIDPVLGNVQRVIAGWIADLVGVPREAAQCGAATLIQRCGSALTLTNSLQAILVGVDVNVCAQCGARKGCGLCGSAASPYRSPTRGRAIRAQTGACVIATYPPDPRKTSCELPMPGSACPGACSA